jgi:hypothetical protein
MSAPPTTHTDEFGTSAKACRLAGVVHRTLLNRVKIGRLPPPTRLNHKVIYWNLTAIKRLMAGVPAPAEGGVAHAV